MSHRLTFALYHPPRDLHLVPVWLCDLITFRPSSLQSVPSFYCSRPLRLFQLQDLDKSCIPCLSLPYVTLLNFNVYGVYLFFKFLFGLFLKIYLLLFKAYECLITCVYVYLMHEAPRVVRRGCWIHWNWSYRWC